MTRRSIVLVLLLSLLAVGYAGAGDLPTAKPEQVGLSSERLERIAQVLRVDVERGRIPGAVVVVARKGRVALVQAVGFRDKATGAPMATDAIFRLASMTKPIVTVAALSLYEEGRLLLSDPVSKYIPTFKDQTVGLERTPAEREMTIQDLMRHTSGLTYGNRGKTEIYKMYPESSNVASVTLTMDELIAQLSRAPLLYQPGTRWEYGLSTDVLGRVVEIVAGRPLGEVLAERVYRPLKMTDTTLLVPMDRRARVLSPQTVVFMTADHLGVISRGTGSAAWPGYTWGLGVAVRQDKGIAPIPGSSGDFYWPGAFATYWWADPKEELAVVFMTQSPLGRHYAHLMRGLVYQAIAN